MRTVTIEGGTADVREGPDITVRQKRIVESAAVGASHALSKLPSDQKALENLSIQDLNLTKDEADTVYALQDATIVASLASWTLDKPLPTLDTIGDMSQGLYDELARATSGMGASIVNGVDFDPPNPSDPEFESSPTPPSDGSEPVSRADQASESTATPSTAGTSTDSGEPSQGSATPAT